MTKVIESDCGNTTILAGDAVPDEIYVDEAAQKRISELLADQEPGTFLRIAVSGGGCSGFQYVFGFDTENEEGDIINSWPGGQVVVDSMSIEYMKGSTVRYTTNFGGESFQVENTQAKSMCGCGDSFSV